MRAPAWALDAAPAVIMSNSLSPAQWSTPRPGSGGPATIASKLAVFLTMTDEAHAHPAGSIKGPIPLAWWQLHGLNDAAMQLGSLSPSIQCRHNGIRCLADRFAAPWALIKCISYQYIVIKAQYWTPTLIVFLKALPRTQSWGGRRLAPWAWGWESSLEWSASS